MNDVSGVVIPVVILLVVIVAIVSLTARSIARTRYGGTAERVELTERLDSIDARLATVERTLSEIP